MPLRGYLIASILQPVSLKRNRKRKRQAACWLFFAGIGFTFYIIIYLAGGIRP